MNDQAGVNDAVVVGGGLGGLAVATYLARGGRRVRLFEKGHEVGGRARTHVVAAKSGDRDAHVFSLNQGPHALYRGGRGIAVLRALGVSIRGGVPGPRSFALADDALHALPQGAMGLVATKLLTWGGRIEAMSLLARLGREASAHRSTTEEEWLATRVKREEVRRLFAALFRVSSYANDPAHHSAGAALAQLARALDANVLYVDGGWQTLVDGLRAAAEGAGVTIETNAHVKSIAHDGAARGVLMDDGRAFHADAVVLAAGPSTACALVRDASPSLRAFARKARPVHAACLDLALERLPNPDILFTLGFDSPLYFSVHSATARVAPDGGALVHVTKYLAPEADPKGAERALEALVDRVQPGWRDVVVERRFMPKLVVSHALVTAEDEGERGRPSPRVPEIPGLYVVGDWVGDTGMLADASLASAEHAARLILGREARRPNVRASRTSPENAAQSRELR